MVSSSIVEGVILPGLFFDWRCFSLQFGLRQTIPAMMAAITTRLITSGECRIIMVTVCGCGER